MNEGKEKLWSLIENTYLTMDKESLQRSFARHLEYTVANTRDQTNDRDCFISAALSVRDRIMEWWNDTRRTYLETNPRRAYYLSMEFLMGRTLGNALMNLGIYHRFAEALEEFGIDLETLREQEPDAGLGNGGLGRLAACFLDSMATLQLPGYGYGIRYDYGIFRQEIENGFQVEHPDNWLRLGHPWEVVRPERQYVVRFRGRVVMGRTPEGRLTFTWTDADRVLAVAHDIPIPGYGNRTVNTLRLWSARALEAFDLRDFNRGQYIDAMHDKVISETISSVLYPKDDIPPGKELRLKQEYFFVSASIQDILRRHKATNPSVHNLADKVAIQLNDTHPALAVVELLRLLLDEEGLSWEEAWEIVTATCAYTNHTMLPEALETWGIELFGELLPRHLQLVHEINRRFLEDVRGRWPHEGDRAARMSLIQEAPYRAVRMSHLAIVGSHSVNGVSALHSELIKTNLFHDFNEMWPEKFNNKTNGITQRRWLKLCNPGLSELISSRIGAGWVTRLDELEALVPLADDAAFREAWRQVKRSNKERLARYIWERNGIRVDPDSMFDCQIKRIHEYKRQLLNVLHVLTLYGRLKADRNGDVVPRTVIFAGKAAPGYAAAKLIIKLIHSVADLVNGDPDVRDRLKVVFLADYGVSLAQRIIPAADLSEQISTAGMEASGTGNMKFALNGALTIGTLDGANIEIRDAVGKENIFTFGLTAPEIAILKSRGYRPMEIVDRDERLNTIIHFVGGGGVCPERPNLFIPLLNSVLHEGDPFCVLADYDAYVACQARVDTTYRDAERWTRMSILNTARMGYFSSDRTIAEYAAGIWGVRPVPPVSGRPAQEGEQPAT